MTDFAEFGRAEYAGWGTPEVASAYASGFATAAQQCVPGLVAAVRAGPYAKALDVCCGQGIVSSGLESAGAEVTGLDFSPAMLDLARSNISGVEFMEGDATALPFEDGSFDAVTMGFGILHIPDSERAISEARRVLRPGGRFAYSAWHGPEVSPAFRIVFGSIGKHGDPTVVLPAGPPIHAYADPSVAFPALENAGFKAPVLDTVDCAWMVDDPATPFDYFLNGTVRGALLLRAQPDTNKSAIRTAVIETIISEFGEAGPWRIPIPAAIVSATA